MYVLRFPSEEVHQQQTSKDRSKECQPLRPVKRQQGQDQAKPHESASCPRLTVPQHKYPQQEQAARLLLGARVKTPKSHEEADDRNRGIETSRDLAAYLRARGRRSRRFFRRVLNEHKVKALLEERENVKERWHDQRRSGEREAFDRMWHMQSPEFAKREARKLMGILR